MFSHLEALRRTLLKMAAAALCGSLLCLCITPQVMEFLLAPAYRVQQEHTRAHLPADVSPADWEQACRLAALRHSLPPQARNELVQRCTPNVQQLADAAVLLRAAAALPPQEREAYLQAAADSPQQAARVLTLCRAGVPTDAAPDRAKLLGAFRPGEAFMLSLEVALLCGLILSSPAQLYFALQFVLPALRRAEKRFILPCIAWGSLLFAGGAAFAYWAVLPRVLSFFYEYSQNMGIENDWRIGYYLGFAGKLILVFGLTFELPVILVPLIKLGLLTHARMRCARAYALVGSLAAALLLAPAPDPATMLIMAAPLYLLFELCLLFALLHERGEAHLHRQSTNQPN